MYGCEDFVIRIKNRANLQVGSCEQHMSRINSMFAGSFEPAEYTTRQISPIVWNGRSELPRSTQRFRLWMAPHHDRSYPDARRWRARTILARWGTCAP